MLSSTSWGNKKGYDLCVNTTNINIKDITPFIAEYAKKWFEEKNL